MLIRYSFSKYLPLINLEIHSILSFVKALLLLAYFTKKKKKKGELSVKEEVRPVAAKIPHVLSSCRLPRGWDQTPYTGICFGLRTNWVLRSPSSWRAWKYQKTEGIAYGEPVCSQVWEYPAAQPQGSDMEKKNEGNSLDVRALHFLWAMHLPPFSRPHHPCPHIVSSCSFSDWAQWTRALRCLWILKKKQNRLGQTEIDCVSAESRYAAKTKSGMDLKYVSLMKRLLGESADPLPRCC